jgi:TatD DNase family protein
MSVGLVDFHCHLDLDPDHATAVVECEQEAIHTLTVTTTPKAWPRNRDLTARIRYVRAALGLHPQLVVERAEELQLWETYLPQARYIGEVGLDAGPRFYRSIELQKQVFERVLTLCARVGEKILTVHSVRAATMVLNMIERHLPPTRGRVVLHWFTGSKAEAQRAIDLGCYFSINAEMLRNNRHRHLVAAMPLDRILTETDGPFCQREGRSVRPADASVVVDLLAQVVGVELVTIRKAVLSNLRCIESFR